MSKIGVRLQSIQKKATTFVSFEPSDLDLKPIEHYMSAVMRCLEDENSTYELDPTQYDAVKDRSVFAYDESTQDYKALEGDLIFCSSAVIKIAKKYEYNLNVLPYFVTSIMKFKDDYSDEIRYTSEPAVEKNKIMIDAKRNTLINGTEPHSIALIDGPLVGGNISQYMRDLDEELRQKDCIPIYFVKNSDSRLVVDNTSNQQLRQEFNNDFHWATRLLKPRSRTAFFKYTDEYNAENTKVFSYIKTLSGFPQRVEMHSSTFYTYNSLIQPIMNLLCYYYIAQGDNTNPQVRPIAIAEKFAKEGIRLLNIPVLLGRMGFHPTINQVRFG